MHTFKSFLTRIFCLALVLPAALALSGCGGGSNGTATTTTTTVNAPNTLVGSVLAITYSDGRTFTFHINSTASTGVTRSDSKTSTNWNAYGYGTTLLVFNVAYGAFTTVQPDNLNNVFDYYSLVFATKTTGTCTIKENTTDNTFNTSTQLTGTFTFTTYPPGG
ncbi:MAG: hypothetical protein ACHQ4G_10870 [Opitutales bacterium]